MLNSLWRRVAQPQTDNPIENIQAQGLQAQLDGEQPPFLLDVREPFEFSGDGHIEGAHLIPLSALNGRLNEIPKDRPVVCICRSGNRSMFAAEMLQRSGHENVYNLGGGMFGWRRAGLPVRH